VIIEPFIVIYDVPLILLVFLLVWYFANGKKQMTYVKKKYGKTYERKSWKIPIILGICGALLFFVYAFTFLFFAENP